MALVFSSEFATIVGNPSYRPVHLNGALHVAPLSGLSGIALGTLSSEELAKQAVYESLDWSFVVPPIAADFPLRVPALVLLVDATTTPKIIPYTEGGRPVLAAARALGVSQIVCRVHWVDPAREPWAWTDATYADTVATCAAAQRVALRHSDPHDASSPIVPQIGGSITRSFAHLLLLRDVVARLEAFSSIDFSGQWPPRFSYAAWKHEAYEQVEADRSCDLDACLQALIALDPTWLTSGPNNRFPELKDGSGRNLVLPNASGGQIVLNGEKIPRGVACAIFPEMSRSPTGNYSLAAARATAARLNALRAIEHAASVSLDADLAAVCAATWASTRADVLARASALYPRRGYT